LGIAQSRRFSEDKDPKGVPGFFCRDDNRRRGAGEFCRKKSEAEFLVFHEYVASLNTCRKEKTGRVTKTRQTQSQFQRHDHHQGYEDAGSYPEQRETAARKSRSRCLGGVEFRRTRFCHRFPSLEFRGFGHGRTVTSMGKKKQKTCRVHDRDGDTVSGPPSPD